MLGKYFLLDVTDFHEAKRQKLLQAVKKKNYVNSAKSLREASGNLK